MEVWLYYMEPGERMPSLFKRMYLTGGFLSLRTVSPFGLFHRPKWQMSLHFYILQLVKFLPLDCIRKKSPLRGHMLFILLAANRCAWTIQKKKKRDIVYSIHQKKIWGMLDIEPGSAAAMNANKDIYLPKGKLKLFHSLNWWWQLLFFFIVTSFLKSALKYLNLLQHFIIIMLQ